MRRKQNGGSNCRKKPIGWPPSTKKTTTAKVTAGGAVGELFKNPVTEYNSNHLFHLLSESSDDDDDDDDEDNTAELLATLQKIRKERAEEKERQEREKQEEEESKREEEAMTGNPLLQLDDQKRDFSVKRR